MGFKTYTCPIERSCGGCEWLAVPYPIQLRRKRDLVEALLGDMAHEDGCEVGHVLGMDEPLHYRHKAVTPYAPGPHGRVRCGFYAQGTHRIVPCGSCLVEEPRCRETLNAVARVAGELGIPAYDEDRGRGLLRHGVVRAGWATKELLLTVVTNGERISHEEAFVEAVRQAAPAVTAIAQNVNQRRTNAILGPASHALLGGGRMRDSLLGCTFELGPTSFYQTNPSQTEVLYRTAIEGAGLASGMRVLDAYCGTGTIGICAASTVDGLEVVGVEKGGEAVSCARRNARTNGLDSRCRFVCGDATKYLADAALDRGRNHFDAVILDPPRAGSTEQFVRSVVALAPERVAYVSCNPETQARDLAWFRAGGYRLAQVTPVDLFPHTKHVECVAQLVRR